ncbi:MAG: hypothetical protein PUB19_05015 [Lachnospiraceae bacterium]|nr:hypothetical protein [Lachnospiraceae bacterium]
MKTKSIPIIIILIAAAISCFASVIQGVSFDIFTKRLFWTVIIFAIIGVIVSIVMHQGFRTMESEEEQTEEVAEDTELENVSVEEQEK